MSFTEINKGNPTGISTGGVGWIIIPDNIDRNAYVANCYRMHMVSMIGGLGYSAIHRVKITAEALSKIKFPDASGERGSSVVWIRDNFYNQPIIIGVLEGTGDSGMTTEGQQRIVQQTAEQISEIFLDAINSYLLVSVQGTKNTPSTLDIKSIGGEEEDEMNFETDGKMNLSANQMKITLTKDIDLKICDENEVDILHIKGDKESFVIEDQYKNSATFSEGNVKILTERFDVGEGKEQMVLGNTLVKLLEDLINAILQLTVLTPNGPSGTPINAAVFSSIKSRLNQILSQLSNTD